MRIIALAVLAILLLALAPAGFASVTTTTIDLTADSSTFPDPQNKVVGTSTCDADEDILVIQVTPKRSKLITLVNAAAWYYRSAASGTNLAIAAGQTITLQIDTTTTIYHTRQSADGAVVAFCSK